MSPNHWIIRFVMANYEGIQSMAGYFISYSSRSSIQVLLPLSLNAGPMTMESDFQLTLNFATLYLGKIEILHF
jgi:hypothetical protein